MHQHPAFPLIFKTRGTRSVKTSEACSLREFQRLDLYQSFFKHADTDYQIGTVLDVKPKSLFFTVFGFNRKTRDYSTHHHTMLDLLRPHFVQAVHNARTVSRLGEQLSAHDATLAQSHHGMISVDRKGRVLFTTDHTIKLLQCYGLTIRGCPGQLPPLLRGWLQACIDQLDSPKIVSDTIRPLVIERDCGSLQVRLARHEQQLLLILEESSRGQSIDVLLALGLRPREAEVLGWVAQGKTNPEVGTILGISSRTVQKHLERIYCRLNVENRHAAICIAKQRY
ncbi:MAG: helix-turn-helix transcriptional regulator [Nitrospira sp.]|nr:helix-turn-helix transcriptional regulator [Nitrospira sp.]